MTKLDDIVEILGRYIENEEDVIEVEELSNGHEQIENEINEVAYLGNDPIAVGE